ncbi:MAG: hypothetical protein A2W91_11585 [Bacteroidetes bacterium GWF2_38_335]|nr:MAG: hypothetical protein A2W91_11585 [Bacteroidetes bacterium GWF2_38_335]OFY77921.1 MAG: hypothetical protein A2281_18330 [Bacteroidetes bacterium RIFOXYA12_FULL_38_20]
MKYLLVLFLSVSILAFSSIRTEKNPFEGEPDGALLPVIYQFESHIKGLYLINHYDDKINYDAFRFAMMGYYNMRAQNLLEKDSLVTIIDFTLPSNQKRMHIINLNTGKIVVSTLVAHGMNTGEEMPNRFSNKDKSKQSCMGFFYTSETYDGRHEYSLKIDGIDTLYNNNARNRGIVFHGADYVSEDYIKYNGRLGRSFGCPALPQKTNQYIVDLIKGGSMVFIYSGNPKYLASSKYLDLERAAEYFCEN